MQIDLAKYRDMSAPRNVKKTLLREFAFENTCIRQGVAALLFIYEFRSA